MSDSGVRRLLIVEDDPEIRFLLGTILQEDDREIIMVERGDEAEEVLAIQPIDLVVLDLILPDTDGRRLLTSIRDRRETASIPVVVISARSGADIRQDCYALGADFFAEKPFHPGEVAADISARLERSVGRDEESEVDPVTGLLNRAVFLSTAASTESEYGLALVQLDGFMAVSEQWGWESAEHVLREASDAIGGATRDRGYACRLGGGEFAIFEGDVGLESVTEVAEEILDAIRNVSLRDPEGEVFRLTASIGVVRADAGTPLDEALDLARHRLFRARELGRNQVVSRDDTSEPTTRRILVAEDDEISATILLHRLRKDGLEVIRFDNGREAYEGALEETPSLVILDVKMPEMDGFEVLERLRRTPSYAAVPIILLTSMGSEADVVRGFQLGADDYILKPFSPTELSARVWRLLRRGRSPSAV